MSPASEWHGQPFPLPVICGYHSQVSAPAASHRLHTVFLCKSTQTLYFWGVCPGIRISFFLSLDCWHAQWSPVFWSYLAHPGQLFSCPVAGYAPRHHFMKVKRWTEFSHWSYTRCCRSVWKSQALSSSSSWVRIQAYSWLSWTFGKIDPSSKVPVSLWATWEW